LSFQTPFVGLFLQVIVNCSTQCQALSFSCGGPFKKLKKEILFLVVVLKTLPTKEAVEALGTKVNIIQLPQSKKSNFVTLLNRRISRPNPRTFVLVAEIINIVRV
jgi:hypothetical protein